VISVLSVLSVVKKKITTKRTKRTEFPHAGCCSRRYSEELSSTFRRLS